MALRQWDIVSATAQGQLPDSKVTYNGAPGGSLPANIAIRVIIDDAVVLDKRTVIELLNSLSHRLVSKVRWPLTSGSDRV
jgi:hypothetical protein